jgi:hypothetical protein
LLASERILALFLWFESTTSGLIRGTYTVIYTQTAFVIHLKIRFLSERNRLGLDIQQRQRQVKRHIQNRNSGHCSCRRHLLSCFRRIQSTSEPSSTEFCQWLFHPMPTGERGWHLEEPTVYVISVPKST